MKRSEISKLEILAGKLKEAGKDFPHQARMLLAIKNDLHLETVNRYFRGAVSSIPIAEILLMGVEEYKKQNSKQVA